MKINGKFSVSPTQQVYFSKGNLQYQASTKTWRAEIYGVNDTNNAHSKYLHNKIDASDWKRKFESNGAVFLPAAGYRLLIYWNHEDKMTVGDSGFKGYYWSSTNDGNYVSWFEFSNSSLDIFTGNVKDHGKSVRLVINVDK